MGCRDILKMPVVMSGVFLTGDGKGDKLMLSWISAVIMKKAARQIKKIPIPFKTDENEIPTHLTGIK